MAARTRFVLVALAVLAMLTVVGDVSVSAAGVRIVGTGDSILGLAYGVPAPGGVISSSDRWLDVEYGRNAFAAGMSGRASTAAIWPLVLARSIPGGWIIVQDNAIDVSDDGWRTLMRRVTDETPNDRCLLGVFPAYRADVDPGWAATAARRATIMSEEFRRQPCRAFVYWNSYLAANPQRAPDGQHPDAVGQAWLRASIGAWTAQTRPTPPTALTAAAPPSAGVGSGQVRLAWSPPASNGGSAVSGYLVQHSADGATWTSVSGVTSANPALMVSGLTNGTTYRFRVAARNRIGWSSFSTVVTAVPRGVVVPGAPRSLTAAVAPSTGVGSGQVRFAWTAPASTGGSALTDYAIQRSTDGVAWTWCNDGVSTSTTATVSGLTDGTLYHFRVTARNAAGWGPPSTVVRAAPRHPGVPSAPRWLTAAVSPSTGVGSGQVLLAWSAPASSGAAPIVAYVVQRSTDGATWTSVGGGGWIGRTALVSGLSNATSYRFRVAARNALGWSPHSNVVTAVPHAAAGPAVVAPSTATPPQPTSTAQPTTTTTTVAPTTTDSPTTTTPATTTATTTTAAAPPTPPTTTAAPPTAATTTTPAPATTSAAPSAFGS